MMRIGAMLVVCLGVGVASCQSVALGVKGGIPITENFDAGSGGYTKAYFSSSSKARRYTVGLVATVNLAHRLGFEIDSLYRRVNYDWFNVSYPSASDAGIIADRTSVAGNRIDTPLLLRWSPVRKLYISAGPSFALHYGFNERRHLTQDLVLAGHSETIKTSNVPFDHRLSGGVAFGLGFETSAGKMRISPELRYTRWIAPAFGRYLFLRPTTNEVDFLVGFEFGGPRK